MTNLEVVEAYIRNNKNAAATARELGIARSTVQWHVSQAALKGDIAPELRATPTGFNVKRLTQHVVKGPEGVKLTEEWTQFTPESATFEATLEAIEASLSKYEGIIPEIPLRMLEQNPDLLTVYPIIDHH